MTINRPHARRPTPNWPDVHGPVRERRPTGCRHHGEPRPPTTMTTNTAEHRNSTTADGANQCSQTAIHYTCTNQDATNQRRHERAGYMGRIRREDHRQQRDGTHTNRADHEAAMTTAHQPHRSCSRHMTVNRPHASRQTPNQPGVQGPKRERRPTGRRHRGAPCLPATKPTDMAEHRNSTITDAANERRQTALRRPWTNQDATGQRRHGRVGRTNNIRQYDHRQRRDETHADQADHEAAKTTTHRPHRSCSRHLTVNRPHASRPTSHQPSMHGSKRERPPSGWRRRDAPRPPATISANKTGTLPSSNRPTSIDQLH